MRRRGPARLARLVRAAEETEAAEAAAAEDTEAAAAEDTAEAIEAIEAAEAAEAAVAVATHHPYNTGAYYVGLALDVSAAHLLRLLRLLRSRDRDGPRRLCAGNREVRRLLNACEERPDVVSPPLMVLCATDLDDRFSTEGVLHHATSVGVPVVHALTRWQMGSAAIAPNKLCGVAAVLDVSGGAEIAALHLAQLARAAHRFAWYCF